MTEIDKPWMWQTVDVEHSSNVQLSNNYISDGLNEEYTFPLTEGKVCYWNIFVTWQLEPQVGGMSKHFSVENFEATPASDTMIARISKKGEDLEIKFSGSVNNTAVIAPCKIVGSIHCKK